MVGGLPEQLQVLRLEPHVQGGGVLAGMKAGVTGSVGLESC